MEIWDEPRDPSANLLQDDMGVFRRNKEGFLFNKFGKYRNGLLFLLMLAVIGGLVFFSGGVLKSRAGTQTLTGGYYMGPNDHVSDWSGENIVVPNGETATIDGSHTFKNLTVQSGGTLTTSPAGAYRKLSREYDQKAFYDHAWVMVARGYYTPSAGGDYIFQIIGAGNSKFDDAAIFEIKANGYTYRAYRANSALSPSPYKWLEGSGYSSPSASLSAGEPYEITAALAQVKMDKSSSPNNGAKLRIQAKKSTDTSYSDLNIGSQIFGSYDAATDTLSAPAAMDMDLYVADNTTDTGVKYDSDFNFLNVAKNPDGTSKPLISIPDYRLFDAKPYYPAQQGPTEEGGVWYTSREYDVDGHLSNNNEEDHYSINLATTTSESDCTTAGANCKFSLDFSSGHTSNATYRYVSPIGYLTVDKADISSTADFESDFTGFYTEQALAKMQDLPLLVISADRLMIENNGKIDLGGRGYMGGRGYIQSFWQGTSPAWTDHASGTQYKYSPAHSGFGPGGGEGYVFGGINERNDGAGGGNGGRGGWYNSHVANIGPYAVAAGDTYPDEDAPAIPGSGGGIGHSTYNSSGLWPGGNGGGQIKLNLKTLVLIGSAKILANGLTTYDITDKGASTGYWAGGGSGGSIDIRITDSVRFTNTDSGLKPISADGATRSEGKKSMGGGGGRIHITAPVASAASIGSYLSVEAKKSDADLTKTKVGVDGTIVIDTLQEAGSPVVSKNTYSDPAYTTREATFEAGQTVYVELLISEPTDSRSDFKIEDMVSMSGSTVTYRFYNSTATDPTSTKKINVSGGKAIFQGSDGITLTHGINKIRYSYKI